MNEYAMSSFLPCLLAVILAFLFMGLLSMIKKEIKKHLRNNSKKDKNES